MYPLIEGKYEGSKVLSTFKTYEQIADEEFVAEAERLAEEILAAESASDDLS